MAIQKKVVTGGLGFIGSHTLALLHQASYEDVVIDDLRILNFGVLDRTWQITGIKPVFYQINRLDKKS